MLTRVLLALIGIVTMVVGALQIFRPGLFWRTVEGIVLPRAGEPVVLYYVYSVLGVLIGLFLLYVGVRKITILSTLIWIIGLLTLIISLIALFAPDLFRDMLQTAFYNRPDRFKTVVSYVGGIIRIVIGFLLLIASFRSPRRVRV